MNEQALVVAQETGTVAGNVLSALSATVWTLTHDHRARKALRKKIENATALMLLGFLIGVVWLRSVDIPEVNQTGRTIHIVEEMPTVSEELGVRSEELEREAETVAKLLYGIRKNSERDLRAVCWVVFNRTESPLYPDSIEEVVNQPGQWVSYYPENPATEELTALATEEIEKWEAGEGRLLSRDTLWFNWSKDAITFREEF